MKLVLFLMLLALDNVLGFCWQPGKNPYFKQPPKVEQVTLAMVRVTWDDAIVMRECADQFLVKYWLQNMPDQYKTTDLVLPDVNHIEIEVTPKVPYYFQAVAREDKGAVRGVDWNKSDKVLFTTSSYNEEVAEPPPPDAEMSSKIVNREIPYATTENPAIKQRSELGGYIFMGMTLEVLAIAIIGVLVVVLVIIGLIYKCFRKPKPADEQDFDDTKSQNDSDDEAADEPCLA